MRYFIALIWLLASATQARAQEIPRSTGHSHLGLAGKFYETWTKPHVRRYDGSRYYSCCNNTDCGVVQIVMRNGKFYAKGHFLFPTEEIELPAAIIEHNYPDARDSPDGLSHACISKGQWGVVVKHCAVFGSAT